MVNMKRQTVEEILGKVRTGETMRLSPEESAEIDREYNLMAGKSAYEAGKVYVWGNV